MENIIITFVKAWETGEFFAECEGHKFVVLFQDGEEWAYIIKPNGKRHLLTYTENGRWGWWTRNELRSILAE